MKTILLDIGGTFIKCSDSRQFPISSEGSREGIVTAIRRAIGPMEGLEGIGVAIPGPFDFRSGIFLMEHKFAAVYGESFRELVRIPDSISIRFMHDVNAALQGNIRLLDLYGQNVALVTLGTGLGFSYSLQGHIFTNEKGSPARGIWNLPYGGGILEDFVSGRGIRVRYSRKTGDATQSALSIAKKAFAGEKAALEIYAQTGAILGEALAPILRELKIDALLMGGQISRSLELMKTTLQNALPGMPVIKAPEQAVFTGLGTLFENN